MKKENVKIQTIANRGLSIAFQILASFIIGAGVGLLSTLVYNEMASEKIELLPSSVKTGIVITCIPLTIYMVKCLRPGTLTLMAQNTI